MASESMSNEVSEMDIEVKADCSPKQCIDEPEPMAVDEPAVENNGSQKEPELPLQSFTENADKSRTTNGVAPSDCRTFEDCSFPDSTTVDKNDNPTVESQENSNSVSFPGNLIEEDSQEASNNSTSEVVTPNVETSKHKSKDINGVDSCSGGANTNGEKKNSNDESRKDSIDNCYCGKKRNLNSVELQCAGCYKWFHESCISISLGKCLPFMTYYTFFCKMCNPSGAETFSKKQPNFSQMCATAIANLTQQAQSGGASKTMFSKDKAIIPYIEANWELLTSMPRRVKQTWHSTVYKAMMKDNDLFLSEEKKGDELNSSDHPTFGLVNQDLAKIGPSYDSMTRGGLQKQIQDMAQNASGFTGGKGRSAKRRFFGDREISSGGKKIKSDLVMPKLPANGYPLEHPFNKDGYRYILAEPDPHAPFRQEFDESQDWAGKPIPGWLYRKLTPNNVLLALHDRAPQLKVSEDRLSVTGEKGYCMIRATHGVSRGTWYFEITIEEMSDGSATRLGWSQALGNLQAPLGYDKFSYSWRSRKGTKFHESRGYHYADEGYKQGDTLGFLIHLPPTSDVIPLPPIFKDKPLVKFKSYLYYEEKDETQLELKRLRPLPGSKIMFYKNGKSQGDAFVDIHEGIYFPAASLYKNCMISFNFGPDFKYPPNEPFKGMHKAAVESLIEQTMTDLLFFTENKGKLRLDNI